MNHRQKLGYIALGAGIMLIGMSVGSTFFTPNIEAQNNGFFDKITCREFEVLDKNGKTALNVKSEGMENSITLYHPNGKRAFRLLSNTILENFMILYGPDGKMAIGLHSTGAGSLISIDDPNGKGGISLQSLGAVQSLGLGAENTISISNPNGITAIELNSLKSGNGISIYDPNEKKAFQFDAYTDKNELSVHNKSDGAGIGFYADYNEAKQIRWSPPKE